MTTLKEFILTNGVKNENGNYELSFELLDKYKDEISKLKEFKNVKMSTIQYDNRDIINEISVILHDNDEVKKDVVLYKVELIPTWYDFNSLTKPVKDGVAIIQNVIAPNYDIVNYICLTIKVEQTKEESLREELHSLLDKILDNPTEYLATPNMILKVSGIFSDVNNN